MNSLNSKRVLQKIIAPHHSWLVIDGSMGTNVLDQAKVFLKNLVSQDLLSRNWGGSSKGGSLVSIFRTMKLPIYFVGLGEQADDLQPFSVDYYLDSILPESNAVSTA